MKREQLWDHWHKVKFPLNSSPPRREQVTGSCPTARVPLNCSVPGIEQRIPARWSPPGNDQPIPTKIAFKEQTVYTHQNAELVTRTCVAKFCDLRLDEIDFRFRLGVWGLVTCLQLTCDFIMICWQCSENNRWINVEWKRGLTLMVNYFPSFGQWWHIPCTYTVYCTRAACQRSTAAGSYTVLHWG